MAFVSSRRRMASFGVALDIDGVLLRGRDGVLPGARRALELLRRHRVPHIFMTNGGGILEEDKAKQLESLLGGGDGVINADSQILLAHTPMKDLVPELKNSTVLVLGCKDEIAVARKYGFRFPVTPQAYVRDHPEMYPFLKTSTRVPDTSPGVMHPIGAVLIMHDPVDWHLELQVCCDVLRGVDPMSTEHRRQIPLYNSNQDFVYADKYPSPRFAQGCFLLSLETLYQNFFDQRVDLNAPPIEIIRMGKPHLVTYKYAEKMMREQIGDAHPIQRFYGVGDNLASDIAGANGAGWRSALVLSGVYQPSGVYGREEDPPAHMIEQGVLEVIEKILAAEGIHV